MIYHTIKGRFMKKISDFIPNKIVKKKDSIDLLNNLITNNIDPKIAGKVRIINSSDDHVVLECDNSSIATVIRFEREKYLRLINNSGFYLINDIKVKIK